MANNYINFNTFFPQEIKLLLEDLNAERRELDVQIDEKRAQLLFIKKDIGKEEENLQIILGQINKHKIGRFHSVQTENKYTLRCWLYICAISLYISLFKY